MITFNTENSRTRKHRTAFRPALDALEARLVLSSATSGGIAASHVAQLREQRQLLREQKIERQQAHKEQLQEQRHLRQLQRLEQTQTRSATPVQSGSATAISTPAAGSQSTGGKASPRNSAVQTQAITGGRGNNNPIATFATPRLNLSSGLTVSTRTASRAASPNPGAARILANRLAAASNSPNNSSSTSSTSGNGGGFNGFNNQGNFISSFGNNFNGVTNQAASSNPFGFNGFNNQGNFVSSFGNIINGVTSQAISTNAFGNGFSTPSSLAGAFGNTTGIGFNNPSSLLGGSFINSLINPTTGFTPTANVGF